jgi:hypothetical protein
MDTINPDKIRSGLSGMLFGIVYMFTYIFLQYMIALAFGEKYQYLKESLILFPPIGIILGFLGGLIRNKRMKISIQNYTISQNKSHVSLKSASWKKVLFGIQINDDAKHKLRCTGFHFPKTEIDKLKQKINSKTVAGVYAKDAG